MSAHHAYLITGELEEGIRRARAFVADEYRIAPGSNPDVTELRFGLLSVEDARALFNLAMRRPVKGDFNIIIIGATRFFHEAQNALLKLFEEPPATTRLFLIVPAEGNVLPTLRSRLVPLAVGSNTRIAPIAEEFLRARADTREKLVAKLLERAKSDDDDEKAAARADAVALLSGLMHAAYALEKKKPDPERAAFLSDSDRFLPMLHERSAPLKLIFEHILLTLPAGLTI